jgi:hypothetical protein
VRLGRLQSLNTGRTRPAAGVVDSADIARNLPSADLRDVRPEDWMRDAALCPEHSLQLESLLKSIETIKNAPVMGTA